MRGHSPLLALNEMNVPSQTAESTERQQRTWKAGLDVEGQLTRLAIVE
jgi:hypothetical protein